MIHWVLLLGSLLAGGKDARAATAGETTLFDAAGVRGYALLVPMEARRAALGEAFVAAGDDGSAAGNPASLGQVARLSVFGSYHKVGSAYGATHDGMAVPLGPGTLAVGFSYFALGEVARMDEYGAGLGREFYYDYAVFLGWGRANPGWSRIPGWVGVAVEAVQEGVGGKSGAITVGEVIALGEKVRAGVVVEHVGFRLGSDSLPAAGRIGATYRLAPTLDGAMALRYGFADHQSDVSVGFESSPNESIRIRAGYLAQSPSLGAGPMEGLSFGLGARWRRFHLDYACRVYGDIGTGQFVTLGWGGR